MMAAGRGEFFRSFLEGLQRRSARQAPEMRPRPGGGFTGLGRRTPGHRNMKEQPAGTRSLADGKEASYRSSRPGPPEAVSILNLSPCELNLLERLPSEILVKILSYLDPSSLFSVSHVSRLLHCLSNDDVLWQRIYTSEFGSEPWKPKSWENSEAKEDAAEGEEPRSHWKKLFLKSVVGADMSKWRKGLRETSPITGLPCQTESVLRNLNVRWQLTLCNRMGQVHILEQSGAHFSKSSVIVYWSSGIHLKFHNIRSIQLHGVRRAAQRGPTARKPNWRSLILKLDTKAKFFFIGKDRLVKVLLLRPGVLVGIWRGENQVAFIMISLHFHKLVERSLLGSSACPYSETVELPPVGNSDPELGLRGYTLHFVLHGIGKEIMSECFQQLLCHRARTQRGLLELRVIERTRLSQHRPLSGSIRLPWRDESLEGAVENCCIMSLTLLDEFQKPFWCVSTPVHITRARTPTSPDYIGHNFQMTHRSADGEVKMLLVWLKEEEQFFLIGLSVYVPVARVNERFHRDY